MLLDNKRKIPTIVGTFGVTIPWEYNQRGFN